MSGLSPKAVGDTKVLVPKTNGLTPEEGLKKKTNPQDGERDVIPDSTGETATGQAGSPALHEAVVTPGQRPHLPSAGQQCLHKPSMFGEGLRPGCWQHGIFSLSFASVLSHSVGQCGRGRQHGPRAPCVCLLCAQIAGPTIPCHTEPFPELLTGHPVGEGH